MTYAYVLCEASVLWSKYISVVVLISSSLLSLHPQESRLRLQGAKGLWLEWLDEHNIAKEHYKDGKYFCCISVLLCLQNVCLKVSVFKACHDCLIHAGSSSDTDFFPPHHPQHYPYTPKSPKTCGEEAMFSKRLHKQYMSNYCRTSTSLDEHSNPLMALAVAQNDNGDIMKAHVSSLAKLISTHAGGRRAQVLMRVAPNLVQKSSTASVASYLTSVSSMLHAFVILMAVRTGKPRAREIWSHLDPKITRDTQMAAHLLEAFGCPASLQQAGVLYPWNMEEASTMLLYL